MQKTIVFLQHDKFKFMKFTYSLRWVSLSSHTLLLNSTQKHIKALLLITQKLNQANVQFLKKCAIVRLRQPDDKTVRPDNSKTVTTTTGQTGVWNKAATLWRTLCVLLMLWCNGCILGHWAALTAIVTIQCRANNGSDFCNPPTTYNSYCQTQIHSAASLAISLLLYTHLYSRHTHIHSRFSVLDHLTKLLWQQSSSQHSVLLRLSVCCPVK